MPRTDPLESATRNAFASALRDLRRESGYSQEGLALAAKVDRTFVSGLERGLHNPTLYTMYKLAPLLGVSPPELSAVIHQHFLRGKRIRRR